MWLEPLGSMVVIVPAEREKVRPSGIELPDDVVGESNQGTVQSVGPGVAGVRPEILVGLRVLVKPYTATTVFLDGAALLVCGAESVLGIVHASVPSVEVGDERGVEAVPA